MAKKSNITFDKALEKYLEKAPKRFALEQVVKAVRPLVQKLPKDLPQAVAKKLSRDPWLFQDDSAENTYISRRHYFHKARFLVVPQGREIEEGVLVPGHRFLPFCAPEVFPAKCKLRLADGKTLRRKKIEWPMKETLIYHTLFGREQMLGYFIYDHESNSQVISRERPLEEEITLTVFNMKKTYREWGIEEGDALLLTVEDWARGEYCVEFLPASKKSTNLMSYKDWYKALEEALDEVFDRLGAMTDIYEQMAHAFFLAGPEILQSPASHVGGFINTSKYVEINHFGINTLLWRKGESPEQEVFVTPQMLGAQVGSMDTLDAILQDADVPSSESEIEAYMRDELYRQGGGFKQAIARCLPPLERIEFYDREQKREFQKLLKKLWQRVEKNYNVFADKYAGKYRRQALEILDRHRKWLDDFDLTNMLFSEFPQREMLALSQMVLGLKQMVESLNAGDVAYQDQQTMSEVFHELANTIEGLRSVIEHQVEAAKANSSLPKTNRRVAIGKSEEDGSHQVYQLKISLLGTRPQIWRRIQVTGDTTLAELHDIIQEVMGWEDCHPHVFHIHDIEYGLPDPFGDMAPPLFGDPEMEDGREVTLGQLVEDCGEKFHYEYDFGDSWEHEIEVEKTIPREKSRQYPLCIDGKYACPPEDCGGIPGFYELLQVMKSPHHPKYEDLIEWLGGPFDPKAFEVGEVNERLRSL